MEQKQQIVKVNKGNMRGQMEKTNEKGKQKQEEPITAGLELQEYVFDGQTPNMYASKEDWLNTYREKDDKTFDETTKLYEEIIHLPKQNVALNTIKDHATETLILAMTMGNKVSKVGVNLQKFPTQDIIHLNIENDDILNTIFLKATLQISKMDSSKIKTQDLLKKLRVENKALRVKFKNLHDESVKVDG